MKKRILTTLALVLLVAMCALTFAACTPTDVGKYMEAIKKSEYCTMETSMGDAKVTIAMDGKNFYMKSVYGEQSGEVYVMSDGDKKTMYTLQDGKWTKTDVAAEIAAIVDNFDLKEMTESLETDEAKYDIKDGVWTEKDGITSYKVVKGKLVISEEGKEVGTYDMSKPSIKLPKEAKEAK